MPQPSTMTLRSKAMSMQKSGGMMGMPSMASHGTLGTAV